MDYGNYIKDTNPFNLAGPPKWWLQKLYDFDNSLVVVPSRQSCVYRLAQRRKLRLTEKVINDALFKQSDTKMLAQYGLVPVTTILATANWDNPLMWQDLAERAPHRQGGAEKVVKMLEDRERDEAAKKQANIDDITTITAKDGWKSYRRRIGLGSTMFDNGAPSKQKEEKLVITDRRRVK